MSKFRRNVFTLNIPYRIIGISKHFIKLLRRGGWQGVKKMKFRDYINEWKKSARLNVSKATSISNDGLIRRDLMPYLENKKMSEITPTDISYVLTQSKLKKHSPRTTTKVYLALTKIFNDAVNFFEIIAKSPVK